MSITKKQIEIFYEEEWADVLSIKSINLLVELTWKTYQLNQSTMPGYVKEKGITKPLDLGQI